MPTFHDLPTKEQIAAIDHVPSLEVIRDDIDRAVAKIETDLEFGTGDDEWANRARNALAYHKYIDTLIGRRLKNIRAKDASPFRKCAGAATKPRERTECADLTWDAIDGKIPDPEEPDTLDRMAVVAAYLRAQVDAISADRADETSAYAQAVWDLPWLRLSSEALRRAKAAATRLNQRMIEVRRAAKAEAHKARDADRCQHFIEVARETLGAATFMAMWSEVDRRISERACPDQSGVEDGDAAQAPGDDARSRTGIYRTVQPSL